MAEVKRVMRAVSVVAVVVGAALAGCSRVDITDPLNGEFVQDPSITVTGNVFSLAPEEAPIEIEDMALQINGFNVPIEPDGSFSTNMLLDQTRIFNPIDADLTVLSTGYVDSDRKVVILGDSIAEGDYSPESIALQINTSGLDALEPVVTNLVDFDLPTLLPFGTVVADNICVINGPFGSCLGRATITIANPQPTMSGFGVDFTPQQDSVRSVIELNSFDLNVFIDGGAFVLVPDCDLNLMASVVTLTGNFALEPDASTPTKVDVAQLGGVSTTFANFDQNFTSGTCDAFFIGDIIQLIIGDVEPLLRGGLEGFLNNVDGVGNTVIAGALESALAGVDISGPVGDALNAQLDAPFFQVQETAGGITLGSDASFATNLGTGPGQCLPPEGAPDLSASYHVAQPFPSFGSTSPGGTPYDVGLGISSSGFNQLLRAQVECGLLVATITEIDLLGTGTPLPLTAGVLSAFFPALADIDPSLPARIEIAPTLAPIITGEPGPGGELALLQIAQLNLQAFSVINQLGAEILVADLMLDADVGIDLSFDSVAGNLVFALAEPDPSVIFVKAVENPLASDVSAVEALLPSIVGSFLPSLAGGLGSFPLPSFLGLNLNVIEVARNGEMLTLYANLQ